MPGRKPKPPALRALTGGRKGKPSEPPAARLTDIDAPGYLSERALRFWPELASLTAQMGILSDGDRIALPLLCEALADWTAAKATIAAEGATYSAVTESGATMHRAHPAVAQRADAARRVQSLLGEFGLTPSARAKVQGLPDLPDNDPAAEYFQ